MKDARSRSSASVDVVTYDEVGLRVSPWPNDALGAVAAQLAPIPGGTLPKPAAIRAAANDLTARGYQRALTVALSPREQAPFLDAGFAVHERLHLLVHDLAGVPARVPPKPRRARREDWEAITATDGASFPEFWQLGRRGLAQAMAATPVRRLRVIDGADGDAGDAVVAYALTGRAGPTGYLQRLAVRPSYQGAGLGKSLTIDCLQWLRRHRADRALVNTQITNDRAFRLYLSVGFRPDPDGLAVLELPLEPGAPA
ncbi:MAG TPA: GNAT family N-acetyltransferase [Acidimicrobiales bacterium]|nr:GNAT family N-acetyltransferase [Acidimicrobiales bacterium]